MPCPGDCYVYFDAYDADQEDGPTMIADIPTRQTDPLQRDRHYPLKGYDDPLLLIRKP